MSLKWLFFVPLFLFYSFFSFLSVLVFHSVCHARWATVDEAIAKVKYQEEIIVQQDGSHEQTVEETTYVIKDAARDMLSVWEYFYNTGRQKISVIEAYSIDNKGTKTFVQNNQIEDKEIASSVMHFDALKRIMLLFPKLGIGSSAYVKYKEKVDTPIPGHFYAQFPDLRMCTKSIVCQKGTKSLVKSALPLYVAVNDPRKVLSIKRWKEGKLDCLQVTVEKDVLEELVDERNITAPQDSTAVHVSTTKTWAEFGRANAQNFVQKTKQEKLPELFDKIATAAAQESSVEKQLAYVISAIQDTIKYMGDIRTINGGYCPHSLAEIAQHKIGDCKDYSTAVAAILNKMGYKANIAMVMRAAPYIQADSDNNYADNQRELGEQDIEYRYGVPSFYNHVICRVEKDGKVYWLDPTNQSTMVDGIYQDIMERGACVFDLEHPTYEIIPSIAAQHSVQEHNVTVVLHNRDITHLHGESIFRGESAQPFAGLALGLSDKQIADAFVRVFGHKALEKDKIITIPDLHSRVVKDIKFVYKYFTKYPFTVRVGGSGSGDGPIKIGVDIGCKNFIDVFFNVTKENISPLFLGAPRTVVMKQVWNNVHVTNPDELNAVIESPWISVHRECTAGETGLQVIYKIVVHKSYVLSHEFRTSDYRNFVADLKDSIWKIIVVPNNVPFVSNSGTTTFNPEDYDE